jgi:hypothetical protein
MPRRHTLPLLLGESGKEGQLKADTVAVDASRSEVVPVTEFD